MDDEIEAARLAVARFDAVWCDALDGVGDELYVRLTQRLVPAVVHHGPLCERGVVRRQPLRHLLVIADLREDVGLVVAPEAVVSAADGAALRPPRFVDGRQSFDVAEVHRGCEVAVPAPVVGQIVEQPLRILGDGVVVTLHADHPARRALEDAEMAGPLGQGGHDLRP